MFSKKDRYTYRELLSGVRMRPLAHGPRTLLCEFLLTRGHTLPLHHHPYEQTGFLISGKIRIHIGEEWHEAGPGDSWCIPENVFHEVDVLEDTHLTEIFSPVRPDYLPGEE